MTGMLMKELLYAKSYKRMFYLLAAMTALLFLLVISRNMAVTSELASYIGMLMGLVAATETFNCAASDEKTKWDAFARSLPVSVFSIIGARYLIMLIFSAAGSLLGVLLLLLSTGGRADGNALFLLCTVSLAIPLTACSVALPLFYRFGYQKVNLILLLLICVWPMILSGGNRLNESQTVLLQKLSPVLLLAVTAVSFFVSCAIYSRKEL